MNKKNLPIAEIEFSLDFFANLLLCNSENMYFAVLTRQFDEDGTACKIHHPAITVNGIDKYAFDITHCMFVPLSEKVTVAKSRIETKKTRILFYFAKNRKPLEYKIAEFRRTYKCRFVNSLLF